MHILIYLTAVTLTSCEVLYDEDNIEYHDIVGSNSNEINLDNNDAVKSAELKKPNDANIEVEINELETVEVTKEITVTTNNATTEEPTTVTESSAESIATTEMTTNETEATEVTVSQNSTTIKEDSTTVNTTLEASAPNSTKNPNYIPIHRGLHIEEGYSDATDDEVETGREGYSYTVSLQRMGAHYATGALVDRQWILTVAGEFYNVRESLKLFRARIGSLDCKRGGTRIPLKRVEIHPLYQYGQPNFDVALLRLAKPVEFSPFISPIQLSDIGDKVVRNAKYLTTYWPRLIVHGQVLPNTAKERVKHNNMRISVQRLIPETKCLDMEAMADIMLDISTLCLTNLVNHHSPCLPDAGAPVVSEDGLWGVTSGWTSTDCATNPSPTVFTRINTPPVRGWFDNHLMSLV